MKKKMLAVCFAVVLAFGLTACGDAMADLGKDLGKELQQMENEEKQTGDVIAQPDKQVPESDLEESKEEPKSEGALTLTAPEGFVLDEASMTWGTAAEEVTNINYTKVGNDGSFDTVTAEIMEPALEASLESSFGEKIDLEITNWETITVDGYEAIDYTIEYAYYDLQIVQRQIIINATDNFHYVTMTYLTTSGYIAAFDDVVASIQFEN